MKVLLPLPLRRQLRSWQRRLTRWPPVGRVDFGSLRRAQPISRVFGLDRGRCIDRYYIERFLARHSSDVKGRVLEIGDNTYTYQFGGDRVDEGVVLHAVAGNPAATIVADLATGEHLPSASFDCVICTQTLQFIYDLRAAVKTLERILKPGGVVLATVPGITQISRYDMDRWGDYWRFTTLSARRLFEEAFPSADVSVEAWGSVLTAIAFLHGIAADELQPAELDYHDPDYELLITVRALKAGEDNQAQSFAGSDRR